MNSILLVTPVHRLWTSYIAFVEATTREIKKPTRANAYPFLGRYEFNFIPHYNE